MNSMHFATQTLVATFKWNTFLQSMNQHAFNVNMTRFLFLLTLLHHIMMIGCLKCIQYEFQLGYCIAKANILCPHLDSVVQVQNVPAALPSTCPQLFKM